jgi:hypothetical protein
VAEGIVGAGRAFFAAAVAAGHEGVVAKRLDSPLLSQWSSPRRTRSRIVLIRRRASASSVRA